MEVWFVNITIGTDERIFLKSDFQEGPFKPVYGPHLRAVPKYAA